MTHMAPIRSSKHVFTAWVLGVLGLIPFAVSAFGMLFLSGPTSPLPFDFAFMGVAYGGVILSFLGGIRWGVALAPVVAGRRSLELMFSVMPSLLGWVAIFLPSFVPAPRLSIALLCIGFFAMAIWDMLSAARGRLPRWYLYLRFALSFGAVTSLVLIGIAVGQTA